MLRIGGGPEGDRLGRDIGEYFGDSLLEGSLERAMDRNHNEQKSVIVTSKGLRFSVSARAERSRSAHAVPDQGVNHGGGLQSILA